MCHLRNGSALHSRQFLELPILVQYWLMIMVPITSSFSNWPWNILWIMRKICLSFDAKISHKIRENSWKTRIGLHVHMTTIRAFLSPDGCAHNAFAAIQIFKPVWTTSPNLVLLTLRSPLTSLSKKAGVIYPLSANLYSHVEPYSKVNGNKQIKVASICTCFTPQKQPCLSHNYHPPPKKKVSTPVYVAMLQVLWNGPPCSC